MIGKKTMWWLLGISLLFGLAFWLGPVTYVRGMRMTVEIEVDGTRHSGTSYFEVSWTDSYFVRLLYYHDPSPRVHGEATVVDLGQRGMVIALLGSMGASKSMNRPQSTKTGSHNWPMVYATDFPSFVIPRKPSETFRAHMRRLMSTDDAERALGPDEFPLMVWLPAPWSPDEYMALRMQDYPTVIGNSAQLMRISVAMSRGQVDQVSALYGVFPWLKAVRDFQQKHGIGRRGQPQELLNGYNMLGDVDD